MYNTVQKGRIFMINSCRIMEMYCTHILYLPDLETVRGANHGQGQGTGSQREEGGRERTAEDKGENMGGGWMREKSADCVKQTFSLSLGKVVKLSTVSFM